jgi:hypothetical protein
MPLTTTYTAIARDAYGRINTNTATVSLSTNSTCDNWAKVWVTPFTKVRI